MRCWEVWALMGTRWWSNSGHKGKQAVSLHFSLCYGCTKWRTKGDWEVMGWGRRKLQSALSKVKSGTLSDTDSNLAESSRATDAQCGVSSGGVSVKWRDFQNKTRCYLSSTLVITVIATALDFTIECQSHLSMYEISLSTNCITVMLSSCLFSILCGEMGNQLSPTQIGYPCPVQRSLDHWITTVQLVLKEHLININYLDKSGLKVLMK